MRIAALMVLLATAGPGDRLVALARLWGAVKYTHPWFAHKAIDWDQAAVEAIESKDELRPTVERMLAHLHDPATRVVAPSERRPTAVEWAAPRVMRLVVGDGDPRDAIAALKKEPLEGLIVDVRGMGRPTLETDVWKRNDLFGALAAFAPRALTLPASHRILYDGYPAQAPDASHEYRALQITDAGPTVPAGRKVPMVFVGDERTVLPPLAVALRAAGAAWLAGPIIADAAAKVRLFPVAEGLTVAIRTEDLTLDGRVVGTPAAHGDPLALLHRRPVPPRPGPILPASFSVPLDEPYPDMTFPALPYRVLAVFRFWNVMHFFHPCLFLADDWDAALPRFLTDLQAATDEGTYALAVARMAEALHDGHASIHGSPALGAFFGEVSPALGVRMIEGRLVVTAVRAPDGPRVGDVITAVDDHPIADVMARIAPYLAASTRQQRDLIVARRSVRGPRGSTANITAGGKTYALPRADSPPPPEPGPRWKLIGDVGYADLTRLELDDVPAMFAALEDTRAIILDMRGYPHLTGWPIAARLNVRGARHATWSGRRQVNGGEEMRRQQLDEAPAPDGALYRGKTVMLIDERAISQSEHMGFFFKAVAGTTLIGSPTDGTDGDVTNVVLPGRIIVSFSGQEYRHLDGTRLQGIGLRPDLEVHPTIAGVRAGRDEVLERALLYLKGK